MTPNEHVETIVRDHAEIGDLVVRLRQALERGEHDEMKGLLMTLQMVETRHYATEDALMRAVDYDRADAHRAEHASMLEMLKHINETLVWEGMGRISPQVVAHLETALAHMMQADEALNRAVKVSGTFSGGKGS